MGGLTGKIAMAHKRSSELISSTAMLVLLMGVSGATLAGSGAYHVCTDSKGRKLFSQTPCPEGHDEAVKEYKVKAAPGGTNTAAPGNRLSYEQLRDSNRKYELKRLIKKNQSKVEKLQEERDVKIREMRTELVGIAGPNANNRAVAYLEKIEKKDRGFTQEITALKKTI